MNEISKKNRELYELIKSSSPPDHEAYADPTKLHHLPFPFIGPLPRERFEFTGETFSFMGREKFGEVRAGVERMLEENWNALYLYGTFGYGKSHVLAALACYLIRQGEQVVYLPDCRAMLQGFVAYTKAALLLTFANSAKLQEKVEELRSEQGIEDFLAEYAHPERLFIIADQMNALEEDKEGNRDSIDNNTKRHVKVWLNKFRFGHRSIESASANHKTFRHMQQKQTNDIKIEAQGGFSTVNNRDYKISSWEMLTIA